MDNVRNMMENMYSKLDSFLKTETVIGEPITIQGVTLIPIISVSFGMGGGMGEEKENKGKDSGGGGGGLGCRISPAGILVIKDDDIKLISLENKGSMDKLFEAIPGLVTALSGLKKSQEQEAEDNTDEEKRSSITTT